MLDRPPSTAAIRARARRARQRDGIRWDLRVRVPTRRLVTAMRVSNPAVGELDTKGAVETELTEVVEAFVERWIGPAKKPHA
jgi:hypothetical protein